MATNSTDSSTNNLSALSTEQLLHEVANRILPRSFHADVDTVSKVIFNSASVSAPVGIGFQPSTDSSSSSSAPDACPSPTSTSSHNTHPSFTVPNSTPETSSSVGTDDDGKGVYVLPPYLCRPLVVSGPSGVGKGTILKMLYESAPQVFGHSISHTTRQPRPGEVDGVQYHFVTKEKFESEIKNNSFLEYAEVHGNFYGTSRAAVEKVRRQFKICLIEIDVQGAKQLYESGMKNAHYIFITAPSHEELEKRLRGRNTETEEVIQRRLKNAINEIAAANESGVYDVFICNKTVERSVDLIRSFLDDNRRLCEAAQAAVAARKTTTTNTSS